MDRLPTHFGESFSSRRFIKTLAPLSLIVLVINIGTTQPFAWSLRRDPKPGFSDTNAAGCHLRELELCTVGVLSIFQNPNGLPSTDVDLKRQCEYFTESQQCFDDYHDRCLSKQMTSTVVMFTDGLVNLAEDFCQTGSELRKNYTKNVACLRDIQKKYQRQCMTDLQVGFEAIHKMNASRRIITLCCNVNRLKECVFSRIDSECDESAIEMVGQMVDRVAGSFVSNACRGYDPYAEPCQSILPKVDSKPHNGRNTSALSRVVAGFTNVPAQL